MQPHTPKKIKAALFFVCGRNINNNILELSVFQLLFCHIRIFLHLKHPTAVIYSRFSIKSRFLWPERPSHHLLLPLHRIRDRAARSGYHVRRRQLTGTEADKPGATADDDNDGGDGGASLSSHSVLTLFSYYFFFSLTHPLGGSPRQNSNDAVVRERRRRTDLIALFTTLPSPQPRPRWGTKRAWRAAGSPESREPPE